MPRHRTRDMLSSMSRSTGWPRALAVAGALLIAGSAAAQSGAPAEEGEVARRAHGFAQQVMSPFCPGRTLADCPSSDAAALREQIRGLLAAGMSEGEIREQLSVHYGDAVIGVPRSRLGWAVPVVLLLAGVFVLVAVLHRISRASPRAATAKAPAELEAELDAELRARGL